MSGNRDKLDNKYTPLAHVVNNGTKQSITEQFTFYTPFILMLLWGNISDREREKKLPHNSIKALTWKDCFASIYTFSTLKTVAQSLDSMKNLILFCLSLFMTCIISLLHHSLANILLRHASQTMSRKTWCSFANLSIY